MTAKRAIVPASQQAYHDNWEFSPGLMTGDLLFLAGATGGDRATGQMPVDPAEQARNAFQTLAEVLTEAGMRLDDVVDMTTYHVGLQAQLAAFKSVKSDYIRAPFPAWTAIGVTELASPGAVIEVKLVARRPNQEMAP